MDERMPKLPTEERRGVVAIWMSLPRGARPSREQLGYALGVDAATITRDANLPAVRAASEVALLAGLRVSIQLAARHYLRGIAARVLAGDDRAAAVLLDWLRAGAVAERVLGSPLEPEEVDAASGTSAAALTSDAGKRALLDALASLGEGGGAGVSPGDQAPAGVDRGGAAG